MEHLAREVGRLARQLQADLEDLRTCATVSNESARVPRSTVEALEMIERRLGSVHDHTSTLVERVPRNLDQVLTELKRAIILRLEEIARTNGSAASRAVPGSKHPNEPGESPMAAVQSLTPQERCVFQLCFQSGFLSYRDIASHLDITPGAAKNLVNRIFQSDRKRPLFAKQYRHGTAKVGVRPDVESGILARGGHRGDKGRRITERASM